MADKKGTTGIPLGGTSLTTSDVQGLLGGASQQANTGRSMFASDPYSQYNVYTGSKPGTYFPEYVPYAPGVSLHPGGVTGPLVPGWQSYQDAALAPTTWGENQLREFVNKGIINKIPGFEVGMGMPQIQNAWQNMVQASVLFNQGLKPGQTPWTPMDVMNSYGSGGMKGKFGTKRDGDWVYDVATGERIKYVGPTSKTVTSKHVDISSPEQAQALITQTLREAIGRAPTAKELARFKASITGFEEAHPTVTTTTQQLKPNLATGQVDVTSESSTTSGGVSDAARASLVSEPTEKTKEYGKYQAANYFGQLLQMMGGS